MYEAEYREIHRRVEKVEADAPSPLRQELTELFINHPAVRPHDQCTPATAKMIRYRLANGCSLGHQIEARTQHLWIAAERLPKALSMQVQPYEATANGKGRHSNVNQMPDMRDRAVARITITNIDEAKALLNALLAH